MTGATKFTQVDAISLRKFSRFFFVQFWSSMNSCVHSASWLDRQTDILGVTEYVRIVVQNTLESTKATY